MLVVDDVDLLRDFTRNFLEMTGLTVLVAGSGPQALKVLEESAEPVDLVFTDYNMPGMNGAELIAQIAARRPEMKFILASGFLNEATVASVGKYQAEMFVQALRHARRLRNCHAKARRRMSAPPMKKLSLAMIVKNEARCLARCLESVRAIVDEIIVADTGSTDGTLEIAAGIRREGLALRLDQ